MPKFDSIMLKSMRCLEVITSNLQVTYNEQFSAKYDLCSNQVYRKMNIERNFDHVSTYFLFDTGIDNLLINHGRDRANQSLDVHVTRVCRIQIFVNCCKIRVLRFRVAVAE